MAKSSAGIPAFRLPAGRQGRAGSADVFVSLSIDNLLIPKGIFVWNLGSHLHMS